MFKRRPKPVSISGTAFGVPIALSAPDAALMKRIRRSLPPQWHDLPADVDEPARFGIAVTATGTYALQQADEDVMSGSDEDVLEMLDIVLRAHVATSAPRHIFLHAGAVAVDGRAVVVPGASFSGKTTLVTALVRAGAAYFSDEYTVLDEDGRVHPYPKPLSIRLVEGDAQQTNREVSAFGGVTGGAPARLGVVAVTQYRPGASWNPEPLSRAELIVELLGAALPVQDRPQQTMSAVRAAASEAVGLRGARGDADEAAADLLARARLAHSAL